MRRFILIIAICTGVLWGGPAIASYEALVRAYAAAERGDYAAALAGFRTLAEKGDSAAQYNLGVMYRRGLGVPQDYAEAIKLFRKAAERSADFHIRTGAQIGITGMYHEGLGVPQDYAEAVKWARKAAELGAAEAQNYLGTMLEDDQGVLQDYVQAHKWYNLAAAQGEENAGKWRDELAEKMTPSQIEKAQTLAAEWRPKK